MKRADVIPPGQLRILCRIQAFIEANGYPPTLRDLTAVDGTYINNVRLQVLRLRKKGLLSKIDGQARSIVPTCRIERIP